MILILAFILFVAFYDKSSDPRDGYYDYDDPIVFSGSIQRSERIAIKSQFGRQWSFWWKSIILRLRTCACACACARWRGRRRSGMHQEMVAFLQ